MKTQTMFRTTVDAQGDKVLVMVQVPTLALLNVEELQVLFARSRKAEGARRTQACKAVRAASKAASFGPKKPATNA